MDKKNAISRINMFGKIGKIIAAVMLVLLGISIFATLASAIFLKVVPDDLLSLEMNTQAELSVNFIDVDPNISEKEMNSVVDAINKQGIHGGLNLGSVRMSFEDAEIRDNHLILKSNTNSEFGTISLSRIGSVLFLTVFSLMLTIFSTVFGLKLCKAIEKCTSPFEENVINKLRLFAYSLIPWALFSSVPESAVNGIFSKNVTISFTLDLNIVLAVLIILALSVIFRYGAILQQESDETL